ncbi:antitoxin MazE [Lactiplantibacillus paraplantarum]|uniref:AbrB/MazE/SpoVT family DNA-binding domain-containing protein n=1 Tax=Lactiplantibacillus paraplantarum TaxID=60520 RepID=UPI0021A8F05C|nr:antitoxin MazE [Lactiplantibacillus paraplantarum]MCT4456211.1 antitoxin MazE [Lactiplantibacillus paraplantarum]
METTIRKIGNAVGIIIPRELNAKVGDKCKITKLGETIVMSPVRTDLFAHVADWKGFRDCISTEDQEWDQVDD